MRTGKALRKWWWIALPLALVLAWASGVLLDGIVRSRLVELASRIAGEGYEVTIAGVDARFFEGSIGVHGIHLRPEPWLIDSLRAGGVGEVLELVADELHIRQVSYKDLLTDGNVIFQVVEVRQPEIQYHFRPDETEEPPPGDEKADDVVEEQEVARLPAFIRVDSLVIREATGLTNDITGRRPSFRIGGTDIIGTGVELHTGPDGVVHYDLHEASVHAWDLNAELPPLYDVHVGSVEVDHPSGIGRIRGLQLRPRKDQHSYGELVKHEVDLFDISMDSIFIGNIDAGAFIAHQVLHAGKVELHSPKAIIYRDKTLPDGEFKYRHLPISGLRQLGISIQVDSVQMIDGVVEYHEKDISGNDFGKVDLSSITGTMTGLHNRESGEDEYLEVTASARVYGATTVNVHFRAPLNNTNDAFTLDAQLRSLPFTVFNRMTDELLNVKASAGTIHALDLHMQGNEWQASGTVDLAYEDLRIDIVPNADKWHQGKIKNLLANAMVRKRNLPEKGNYRQGTFTVDRRKDRAIFNFIWQAIKVGSVDSMAPGLFRQRMREAAKHREN